MIRKLCIIQLFFLLLLIAACGGQYQQMTAVEKASVVAKEISKTYIDLYNLADNITKNGTITQQEYMKSKINPKLNDAKKYIIEMDKAVAYWKKYGTDTQNATEKQEALQKLLAEISNLIIEIM